ncbi:disease resistance protein RPS2-like [Hevea brasiliensis]|uniref:disease resistance protein RPS2-like n=1 Tax=Hevea brasiliensis TaxID=3981 RepID=UPI0025DD7A30|nr:disease resistance protein RPS2-like [Hevea brasiliensis]
MECSLRRIMESIEDSDVGRIGIYGGAKIQKPFVEGLKYLFATMVADMFENIIWVTVPKVWNLRNLQLEISGQLPSNVIDSTNINSWELLMVLERMKFLLILHDVRQFISLEKVGIPRPTAENGCKIGLIARSEEVCDAMGVDSKIGLKDLSSWELFHGNVGEVADSSSLKPLATQVLNMCADYSLAIVLMAGALKDVSDVEVWRRALETLRRKPDSDQEKLEILMANVLMFSYEHLQDDKTRKCLRNYALFCENGWIASELLMQRWIFDGLIDAHDQGKKMLETLINFSLLDYEQEIEFVKMKKKIRYILLEYIVPTEEAQVLFLINGGMGLTKPPKVEQWEGLIEIGLMDNHISELPISPSCPKLRKLFLERNYKLRIIPPFFDNMPALQVLNLSRTSIKSLPESLFKLLNLRRLFLNRCVLITTLSPEVGELKQLEVLDLEGTEIMFLPKEVGQLTNLTCLEVSFFEPTSRRSLKQSSEIIPCGAISALYLLEELNIDMSYDDKRWNASAEEVISELCRLQWLHTLKVYLPKVEFLSYFNWNEEKMVFPSVGISHRKNIK